MKKLFCTVWDRIKSFYNNHAFAFIVINALIMNTAIECLGRRSFSAGIMYIFERPLMFLFNALIIFMTMSVCLIFKRRTFGLTLISLLWLTCGIVNCVLLGFRTTPFSAVDLQILSSVMGIVDVYFNQWQIVLLFIGIFAALCGLVFLWLKAPKVKESIHYIKSASLIAAAIVGVFVISSTTIAAETSQTNYPNIADAYENYGFAYCFSNSLIDQGIKRPEEYSEEKMAEIKAKLDGEMKNDDNSVEPNIIMIQLESFFDVNYITDMKFSENPVPNFTKLKQDYTSGFLTVPSIGAGTANTEFEIISGMSLDFFGASEYPYKTVLKDEPCESVCYDLNKYDYKTHAIHNNDGTFYDRHIVFTNLGFDTFTSLEYMDNVQTNPLGWAEDDILLKEIADAVELTDERDFVYTITVQSHGKYPSQVLENAPLDIKINSCGHEMTDELKNATEYYINQIHEVDNFIKDVTDYFADYDEPVVIVMYGDHLPNLELTDDLLENGSLLQTEYVIWNNFGMDVHHENLDAFRLSAYTLNQLGLNGGYVNTYNMYNSDDENYPELMHYLGYDMLFGEKYIYQDMYLQKDMTMGVREISVSGAVNVANEDNLDLDVYGENFTPFSVVMINGRKQETVFETAEILTVYDTHELKSGDIITVAQIGDDNEILSLTEEYVCE